MAHVEIESTITVLVNDQIVQVVSIDSPNEVTVVNRVEELVDSVSASLVTLVTHTGDQNAVPVTHVYVLVVFIVVLDFWVEGSQSVVLVVESRVQGHWGMSLGTETE